MGHHLVVSRNGDRLMVESIPGENPRVGLGQERRPGWKVIYVEFAADSRLARLRSAWLQTPGGRAALDKALAADARGECDCDNLLFGECGWI